jgi:hypothetical protein
MARKKKTSLTPDQLSDGLWDEIERGGQLDAAGLTVLRVALEALDRLDEARKLVTEEGLTLVSPRGAVRPHPALRVEREARAGFLAALGRLGLMDKIAPVEIPGEDEFRKFLAEARLNRPR